MTDLAALHTLGDIDDRCALTGEDPVNLLRLVLSARQASADLYHDLVEVVA